MDPTSVRSKAVLLNYQAWNWWIGSAAMAALADPLAIFIACAEMYYAIKLWRQRAELLKGVQDAPTDSTG